MMGFQITMSNYEGISSSSTAVAIQFRYVLSTRSLTFIHNCFADIYKIQCIPLIFGLLIYFPPPPPPEKKQQHQNKKNKTKKKQTL